MVSADVPALLTRREPYEAANTDGQPGTFRA
jgi:hypothetical protein